MKNQISKADSMIINQSKPTSLYEAIRDYISADFSVNNSLLVLAATKHFYKMNKKRGRK
ncbi:MAG: hypothetical protein M0P71_18210 [Melioribacteraceae bacterium]|jgi:hypothetical protein|nr:hypothetical protein [Melioribacteraceae bacterium]